MVGRLARRQHPHEILLAPIRDTSGRDVRNVARALGINSARKSCFRDYRAHDVSTGMTLRAVRQRLDEIIAAGKQLVRLGWRGGGATLTEKKKLPCSDGPPDREEKAGMMRWSAALNPGNSPEIGMKVAYVARCHRSIAGVGEGRIVMGAGGGDPRHQCVRQVRDVPISDSINRVGRYVRRPECTEGRCQG